MASTYATPESDITEMEAAPQLLPPELWTFMYLVHGPNVLGPAVKVDPMRVAQIFASQNPPPSESSPRSLSLSHHPPPLRILEYPPLVSRLMMEAHPTSAHSVPSL